MTLHSVGKQVPSRRILKEEIREGFSMMDVNLLPELNSFCDDVSGELQVK